MKKNLKIIIKLILILVISIIAIYIIYKYIIFPTFPCKTGIVVAKNEKTIILKDSVDTTERSCSVAIETIPVIKDIGGKKLQLSDLNIGDKIAVTYKNHKSRISVAWYPPQLNNIKLIQIIESNKDNHMSEDELAYNDFTISRPQFNKDSISFVIDILGKSLNTYLFTDCKIVNKSNNAEDLEIRYIDSTEIALKSIGGPEFELSINVPALIYNLENGKYVLKLKNEELGLIKIPFEKNRSGITFLITE